MKNLLFLMLAGTAIWFAVYWNSQPGPYGPEPEKFNQNLPPPPAPPEKRETNAMRLKVDASPEKQEQRLELIKDLLARGLFTKIEAKGTLPHVYVDRAWSALKIDEKTKLMEVVFCYYLADAEAETGHVRIFNGYTGKEIGSYRPGLGLELD